jgi:hypothetical protein
MKQALPITFAAVARQVSEHGWRPFPGLQTTKVPAMPGWNGLNLCPWDDNDLAATITDYAPADQYACCLAVQPEIVALDFDITDSTHAAYADDLANKILGDTPLVRIGFAPKQIRVYRSAGGIKSRKLHPLEIFSGSGQFIAFGWHEKAGRPYLWPHSSPITTSVDSSAIPIVKPVQIERFAVELFKVVPRRLAPTKQCRDGGVQTIGERLRMLAMMHGSWKRAAAMVLSEACDGSYNETLWAVVTSASGRGISEEVIWELVEKHFNGDPTVSDAKIISDLESMIERVRPRPRHPSSMSFINGVKR